MEITLKVKVIYEEKNTEKNLVIHDFGGWFGFGVGGMEENGQEPLIFSADLALTITLGGQFFINFTNLLMIPIVFYVYIVMDIICISYIYRMITYGLN